MAAPGPFGPPGADGRPPYGAPAPPPVPAEQRAAAQRAGRLALLLAVAALLMVVPLPPAGAVVGAVAVVRSISATRRLGAARAPVTPAVLGIVGGALAVIGGLAITAIAFWLRSELGAYGECLSGANTRIAEQACRDQLEEDLFDRLSPWSG